MKLSVVLAVLLGTLVVACSSATPTPNIDATIEARVGQILTKIPTETPIPTLTPVPTAPPSTSGEGLAPNFSFNLYQGEDILGSETKQLSQLRGTPVVLNFWARLCPWPIFGTPRPPAKYGAIPSPADELRPRPPPRL